MHLPHSTAASTGISSPTVTSSQLVSCLWKWCRYFCAFVLLEKSCSSLLADFERCHCGWFQRRVFRGPEWKIPSCRNRMTGSASLYGCGWRNDFSLSICQSFSFNFFVQKPKWNWAQSHLLKVWKAKYWTQLFSSESDLTPFCVLFSCCSHCKMSFLDSHICHQVNKESSWWCSFVTPLLLCCALDWHTLLYFWLRLIKTRSVTVKPSS